MPQASRKSNTGSHSALPPKMGARLTKILEHQLGAQICLDTEAYRLPPSFVSVLFASSRRAKSGSCSWLPA
jgi:hypothetical protein